MNFGDLRLCYIYIFDSFLRCNPSQKWFHVSEKYGPCKRSMTIILKFEKTKLNLALRNTFLIKVHIFLKGHKILQNLHLTFVLVSSILKMVGPKTQEFCPRINMLKGIFLKTILWWIMVHQKVLKLYFQSKFSMSKIDRIFSRKIILTISI